MTNVKKSNVKKSNKGHRSKNAQPVSPTAEFVRSGAKSVVLSLSAAFVFVLVGAYIAFRGADPSRAITPIALSALYLSGILCGFLSSKLMKGHLWLNGAMSCFAFMMTVMTVSLFLGGGTSAFSPGTRAVLLLLMIPSVFAGVLLGKFKVVKKRKSPYRRR